MIFQSCHNHSYDEVDFMQCCNGLLSKDTRLGVNGAQRSLQVPLENESVRRINSLIVLFLSVHYAKAKLLVEFQGFVVAHLHMPAGKYTDIIM